MRLFQGLVANKVKQRLKYQLLEPLYMQGSNPPWILTSKNIQISETLVFFANNLVKCCQP